MVRLLAGLWVLSTLMCAAPAVPATAEQTPVGPIPGPRQEVAVKGKADTSDSATLAEGRRLFIQFNCYGCHGGRAGGGMGPSLRDADWIYGSSPANIYSSISEGR
ncbi:MAG TPA: c-type cytochrome, partial [Burkholderiales bacterium]|nr:c-type cytochrome [Burkholderiales bacterium]